MKTRIEYRNDKGQLHRLDGPAIEYSSGSKHWCVNNKLHREDGPAVENSNGTKEWFLNGIQYTEEEFIKMKLRRIKDL